MGGCCCCSSKDSELSPPPAYYFYPRVLEEHVPLSSHHGAASAFSGGLLVDTNLDTSSPDTYRPPPPPTPFNVALGVPTSTPLVAREICDDKTNPSLHTANSNSVHETVAGENHGASAKLEDLKELEFKVQTALELDSAKDSEIEPPKLAEPFEIEEEDVCPICLEEYDAENPKLTTKCDHYFHLACILEWMERSETCPVCDKDMALNLLID